MDVFLYECHIYHYSCRAEINCIIRKKSSYVSNIVKLRQICCRKSTNIISVVIDSYRKDCRLCLNLAQGRVIAR